MTAPLDKPAAIALLNRILEMELASAIHYTHYSLMVFGYNRIPIVSWLRQQAQEALRHAELAGELVTHFGEHPSLAIGPLLESQKHEIGAILRESLAHEQKGLELYRQLLEMVSGKSVVLEEYARKMVETEELHVGEVDKMLRNPGEIKSMR
jgi:bacterioferritin